MPVTMDANLKKRLKDNLDYDNNGRLSAFANKAAALNEPILIIGLGGTGVDAVINVKRMIYDRLKCEVINGEWQDKPENIEYLCLDTDINSKDRSINGLGFNESRYENFTFTNPKLSTILKNKENYLTMDARSWINDDLHCDMVVNGAGAIRQVGRLMMFMNVDRIVSALESKITSLSRKFDSKIPIKVFILSGIGGGTGSGTFLDIPYIIKGITNKPEIGRTAEIIGILFLPDVNTSRPSVEETKKQSIKRNGFAALKELDYLMNLSQNGEYFEQNYGNLHVRENSAPYYACILMSSKAKTGKAAAQPYEYTINVAAETVVNFIAREEETDSDKFSINSFLSNQQNDKDIFTNNLGKNKKPVNYTYCLAGASSAYLPIDDLISYMTYLAFQQIDQVWNLNPKDADVMGVIERFVLGEESMKMKVNSGLPRRPNMDRHRFEMIEQNSALIISDYENTLKIQKEYVDGKILELVDSLKARLDADDNIINEYFRDINKGPILAQRVIYNTSENCSCVVDMLKKSRNNFLTQKPNDTHLSSYRNSVNIALDKIRERKLIKNKSRLREDFLNAANLYYDETIRQYIFDGIAEAYDKINRIFMNKNQEVYDYISDLMNTLVMIFQKYGKISTQTTVQKHATGETLTWYMVDTPTFIKELSKRMGQNDELYIDLTEFITKFYGRLFENIDIWSGKEKADVVEVLNRFIWEEFQKVLDKSMDYYIEFFANCKGKKVEDYCKELLMTMDDKANIMFSFNAAAEGLGIVFPGHSSISVPINAQSVKKYAMDYAQKKGQVFGSSFVDRMFMMNYKTAVPLYFYDELIGCEEMYEANYKIPGVHLYEINAVSEKDWHQLPSPYPESEWMEGQKIPRLSEDNNIYRKIFDKAKEYGFITWSGSKYFCNWGRAVDYKGILDKFGVDPDRDYNNPGSVRNAYTALKDQLADKTRLTIRRPIFDCIMMNDDITPNDDYAKNTFIRMPEAKREIKKTVENYEACMAVMDKIGTGTGTEANIRNYLRCIFTDVVYEMRGGIFKYKDKDGISYNLHTLEGKEANYPEFYLYNAFTRIDKGLKEKLEKYSTTCFAEISESDEKYAAMKAKAEEYVKETCKVYNRLKEEWQEVPEGDLMLDIYKNIMEEAEAYCKKL